MIYYGSYRHDSLNTLLRRARDRTQQQQQQRPQIAWSPEPQKEKLELLVGLLREATLRELDFLAPILDDLKYWREFIARGAWAVPELGPLSAWAQIRRLWALLGLSRFVRRVWPGWGGVWGRVINRKQARPKHAASPESPRGSRFCWRTDDDDEEDDDDATAQAMARAAALSAMLRQRAAAVVELNRHVCAARPLRQRCDDDGSQSLLERGFSAALSSTSTPPSTPTRLAQSAARPFRSQNELKIDAWMLRATRLLEAHVSEARDAVLFVAAEDGADGTTKPALNKKLSHDHRRRTTDGRRLNIALRTPGSKETEGLPLKRTDHSSSSSSSSSPKMLLLPRGGSCGGCFLSNEEVERNFLLSPPLDNSEKSDDDEEPMERRHIYGEYRQVPSLSEVVRLGEDVLLALERRRRLRLMVLAPHRRPSWARRHWLTLFTMVPLTLFGTLQGFRHRETLRWAWRAASEASKEFVALHVVAPTRAIVAHTLFLRRQRLADAAAVAEATHSLEVMLGDWLRERYPQMKPEEVLAAAGTHDMRRVTREYEKSLAYSIANIVAGDLVRMILIQVQFIKKELLVAMAALEELTEANDFNFRAMATVPAVLAAYCVANLSKGMYNLILGRPSRRALGGSMQAMLRELERLLTHDDHTVDDDDDDDDDDDTHRRSDQEGLVLLCVHQIRKLLARNRSRFTPEARMHLLEDFAELAGERGDISLEQRLLVVQRIQRWHPFLRPIPSEL